MSRPKTLNPPIFTNAALTGLVTVALPLELDAKGASKAFITLYFVGTAITTASLNVVLGRHISRIRSVRTWISGLNAISAAGLIVITVVPLSWMLALTGPMVMASGMAFSLHVSVVDRGEDQNRTRTASGVRMTYVLGYVAGLGSYSAAVQVQEHLASWLMPTYAAAALAVANACAAWATRGVAAAATVHTAPGTGPDTGVRRFSPLLACAALSVTLARAADSLRQVYLPLYSVHVHISKAWIAALFAISSTTEVLILYGIGRIGSRTGPYAGMQIVCGTGAVAFGLMAIGGDLPLLLLSQVLYASFGAGFQSFGMLLVADVLRSGLGKAAAVYTALSQLGSVVGLASPLLLPGYTARIFLVAALFCLVAASLATGRHGREGHPARQRKPDESTVHYPSR